MIRYIKGRLLNINENRVVIENSGIGYMAHISMSSRLYNSHTGDEVEVFTSMIVREDDISLYAFDDMDELELFEKLITVNGVGAKAAMAIFSAMTANMIKIAIAHEDVAALTRANGIGKKTAQRIVIDLRDKIGEINMKRDNITENIGKACEGEENERADAVNALISMGFSRSEIMEQIDKTGGGAQSAEEYIKSFLKNIGK